MFHALGLFSLCSCCLIGVFGESVLESVSVMEGDAVTLNTGVTQIHEDDDILWNFGAEKSLIAHVRKNNITFPTSAGADERFRDRLKLDQTGSLTITNTTTLHTGLYEMKITGAKRLIKTFNVSVCAHLLIPDITRDCTLSSSSSSSCSLSCSVVNVGDVTLSWFRGNSLLSSISVSDLSISLSLPLEVEYQDNNTYSCVLNNTITNHTTHLDIYTLCQPCADQGLPLLYIELISAAAASLLIIVSVVIYCIHIKHRKTVQTQVEDRAEPALFKPTNRKMKSEEPVYVNIPPRR